MAGVVRVSSMVLRLCAAVALLLGLLIWAGQGGGLVPIHMLLGLIAVICVCLIGAAQFGAGRRPGLGATAIAVALLLLVIGVTQRSILTEPGAPHWVIRVVHLLVAMAALALAEISAGRYRRQMATA